MFRLRTLGGASLERDGEALDSAGGQRKTLALLALLAAARQQGISRDRLAAYLWPDSDTEHARGALKQALHVVRRQLESADAILGTSELRLNPAHIQSDVDAFLTALENRDMEYAVNVYGGPFLDGFHLPDTPEFEQWTAVQRDALARRQAAVLEQLARTAEGKGDYGAAIGWWRRLQTEDPLSGRVTVGLMNALDAAGERAAALRCALTHETLLRDELGSPPDATVTALAARLREEPPLQGVRPDVAASTQVRVKPVESALQQDASKGVLPTPRSEQPLWRRSRRVAAVVLLALAVVLISQRNRNDAASAAAAGGSIAVLPFVNADGDSANEHLSDGLTDELIGALGKVDGLRVAARTSTFALKGKGLDVRSIADTLGVMTVLEGTVRRNGDRLEVTARLVNARDHSVLWSQMYDRHARDVFAVQDEIVRAIVGALPGSMSLAQGVNQLGRPTTDMEAYELYLKGRHNTWTLPHRERLEQAAVYFHRAAERDPNFAMAYAALAEVYVNLSNFAYLTSGEALARAKVSAAHALELDPNLAEAHTSYGYVLAAERDFAGAEKAFQRALALNPNFPWAHHYYCLLLVMLGRTEEALEHNAHALARDPLSLPANATRGIIFGGIGDFTRARRELERTLRLGPNYPLTLFALGGVRAAEGAYPEALVLLQRAADLAPGFPGVPGALASLLVRAGQKAAADSVLAGLQREPLDERARTNLAFAYAALGRTDAAFPILAQLKWDVASLLVLRTDPFLSALRADSSYQSLLRDIGVPGS